MKVSRLELATKYLIDLMRAYGHRPITVRVNMDGESVEIMARNFVKRQLTKVGILFSYTEANKANTLRLNSKLDNDMVSVIFHEALFEFEAAYVEEKCHGNPNAEYFANSIYDWIDRKQQWLQCTFPNYTDDELDPFPMPVDDGQEEKDPHAMQEAIAFLSKFGIEKKEDTPDLNKFFWEMAVRRKVISKPIREAVRTVIVSDRLMKAFNNALVAYNEFIEAKTSDPEFVSEEQKVKDMAKAHKAELNQLAQAQKQEEKAKNQIKMKLQQEESMSRKLTKKFMNQLKTHHSRFQQSYDLTQEKEIEEFLSWYKVLKRPVNKKTIKDIVNLRLKEPGTSELFLSMVEAHNELFAANASEEDEVDEEA